MSARSTTFPKLTSCASSTKSASSRKGVVGATLIAGLDAKRIQLGMADAIAADEVHHQKHQERATDHHHDSDLQTENQVRQVVKAPYDIRSENSAKELRRKHIDADRRSVSAARHHVVNHRSQWSVIPGHEKAGDEKRADDLTLFFAGDGP